MLPGIFRSLVGSRLARVLVTMVLAAAGTVVFGPSMAVAVPVAAALPDPGPCLSEAADEVAAAAMAARCGVAVEALDQRSETAQVWAKPDGTFTARLHGGPERFRDGDLWRDVDLTLERKPDGSVAPRAHPRGLTLAGQNGAAEADLVSVRTAADALAQRLAMTWTGALPVPVLDGHEATYVDALPGIDLVVTVSAVGFEQFLVVKNPAALSRVSDAQLGLKVGGLSPVMEASGGISFKDGAGNAVVATPTALMWDAATDAATGMPAHVNRVGLGLDAPRSAGAAHRVRLSADQAWLTDPARQFPITIDPGLTADKDLYVRKSSANSNYIGSTELLLGTSNGGSDTARSFLRWIYDPIYGAKIFSGSLKLWEHHAYSCRDAEWQLWSAGWADHTTTWNNMPTPGTHYHSSTQTRGHPDCTGDGWVSIEATNFLQDVANAQYPYTTMLLMAGSETNNDGWKRFNSDNAGSNRPYLDINYTKPPTVSNVKVAADCVSSCTSPVTVRVLTPQLQATVSDPEGTNLSVEFEVWNSGKSSIVTSTTLTGKASGSTVSWTTGTLANKTQYHFRVRSKDTPGAYSAWSAWSTFTPDTSGPGTPSSVGVTGDCYNSCTSPAMLRTARPTFKASVSHPFSDSMTVAFEVWNAGKTTKVTSGSKTAVAAGTTPTWQPSSNLPQNQQLHLKVQSTDTYGRASAWSGWYTFTTDATVPVNPAVSSSKYKHKDTGTWNGGAGVPGAFTFGPGTSADVVQFQWKINGGSVTSVNVSAGASANVTITPAGDLEQLLQVRSLDSAGWTSAWQDYPFLVRTEAVDVAYWKLDGTAVPANGGSDYTGILFGGPAFEDSAINPSNPAGSGQAIRLDGVDDYIQMPRVLATDHVAGFSVSAWVKPSTLSGYDTVVAQQGVNTYAFRLYYKPESNQWCFSIRDADDGAAGTISTCSDLTPQAGMWTHLAGVYDPVGGKIRLYVNGGPHNSYVPGTVSEANAPPLWAATGSLRVGRSDGGAYFHGLIDEVRAYQRVLPEVEARQLFVDCWVNSCPQVPAADDPVKECLNKTAPMCVGEWKLDEGTGTITGDSSEQDNSLTFTGSAAWTEDGYRGTSGVSFDGTSGYLATDGPVLLTDQSYTVSAWVKPDQLPGDVYLLQQPGTDGSSMYLHYRASSNSWRFVISSHDGVTLTWHVATASGVAKAGVWTHLAGVYDAGVGQMRLYVNGQLAATANNVSGQATPSDKALYIGGQSWGAVLDGTIDLVRAYQGALSNSQVAALYAEQVAPPVLKTWWELEEFESPAYDYSENGNHGELSAAGAEWTEGGHDGAAVTFDGVSGSIETANPVLQTNDSVSLSAWVKLSATASGEQWVLAQCGELGSAVKLFRDPVSGKWVIQVNSPDGSGGLTSVAATSDAVAQLDVWVHLTGVFDAANGQVRLYVNGQRQATTGTGAAGSVSTFPLTAGAGRGAGGYSNFFTGTIDSVRAYQGALSDTQAQQLFEGQEV